MCNSIVQFVGDVGVEGANRVKYCASIVDWILLWSKLGPCFAATNGLKMVKAFAKSTCLAIGWAVFSPVVARGILAMTPFPAVVTLV